MEANELPLAPAARAEAEPVVPPSRDQELPLPFAPIQEKESPKAAKPSEPDSPAPPQSDQVGRGSDSDQWSMSGDDRRQEQPFTMPDTIHAAEAEKILDVPKDFTLNEPVLPTLEIKDDVESLHNILPMATYLDQRASIFPYLTLFVVLVIGFSLIAMINQAHPQASEQIVKKIPLIGASVLRNNHLKDGILIQSLQAGYQTIQGNREVFLISGIALNQNPVVIREIQVVGKTFNQDGKELESQTIWAGNSMSSKILRGMTTEDIPHLQNLKPLKTFEVPPGDSVPFTIVFLKSVKATKDFSCEVVMAQGEV